MVGGAISMHANLVWGIVTGVAILIESESYSARSQRELRARRRAPILHGLAGRDPIRAGGSAASLSNQIGRVEFSGVCTRLAGHSRVRSESGWRPPCWPPSLGDSA